MTHTRGENRDVPEGDMGLGCVEIASARDANH